MPPSKELVVSHLYFVHSAITCFRLELWRWSVGSDQCLLGIAFSSHIAIHPIQLSSCLIIFAVPPAIPSKWNPKPLWLLLPCFSLVGAVMFHILKCGPLVARWLINLILAHWGALAHHTCKYVSGAIDSPLGIRFCLVIYATWPEATLPMPIAFGWSTLCHFGTNNSPSSPLDVITMVLT